MSYCKKEGKDQVIFVTAEDHCSPSKESFVFEDDEESPGLVLENGDINWSCPCLGGMATGPCGVEFREAFSCFHYSKAEPKGSECLESFKAMSDCMAKYPGVYGSKDEDFEDLDDNLDNTKNAEENSSISTSVSSDVTKSTS